MLPLLLTNRDNQLKALVVGGGRVAQRRVTWLRQCGITQIDIIATSFCAYFREPEQSALKLMTQPYTPTKLAGYTLILACTPDSETNDLVARNAREAGILCNRADNPAASDFIVPATLSTEELTITVNSGVPAYSQLLRTKISSLIPESIDNYISRLRQIREILIISDIERNLVRSVMQQLTQEEYYDQVLALELKPDTPASVILDFYSNL